MNSELSGSILRALAATGVREICVCPAGRNAPLVQALAGFGELRPIWFFEERSAAFFALGRARAAGRPVAVSTTSGTAAGELLPAAMEAYYSGVPLIFVTADRPRRYRGSGAPQSAEQMGMFGVYARTAFDLAAGEALPAGALDGPYPAHLNVCFEEPGPRGEAEPGPFAQAPPSLAAFLDLARRPLAILGALAPEEQAPALDFVLALGLPVLAEAPSGLREVPEFDARRLRCGDGVFARAEAAGAPFDGVLRLGGVPTHRLWRDLEDARGALPVFSVSRLPFTGLGRPSGLACGDLAALLAGAARGRSLPVHSSQGLFGRDRAIAEALDAALRRFPRSEPGLVRALSERIEPGADVYLGNSLPVRDWDLAAARSPRGLRAVASRGLNGIDGQVSTFLGLASPARPAWALLGDLTALYDLAGPWPAPQLAPGTSATLVVLNNGGGRIFERMFPEPAFQNRHELSFEAWAALWGLPYQRPTDPAEIGPSGPGLRVVELRPDPDETAGFWRDYDRVLAAERDAPG